MMHIVVYYGYENPKDIRVSIDGMPSVDARKAIFEQMINLKERDKTPITNDLFSPRFTPDGFKPSSPRFDWKTVTPEELKKIIEECLSIPYIKNLLKDPVIKIECIKGKSP